MPGLNGYEFIILGVLAVVLLGPERLPAYAQTLARWVRQARSKAEDAKEYFREETGTDFDEVDWKRYDPRQYDPRRIIREALAEDYEETRQAVTEVRDSARLPTGRRGTAAGSARGAAGSGSSRSTSGGAAASGAATGSGADDPRSVFGGASAATGAAMAAGAAGAAAGTTPEGSAGGSALAAGMAGAGVQPGSTSDDGTPEVPGLHPAPFDVDAT